MFICLFLFITINIIELYLNKKLNFCIVLVHIVSDSESDIENVLFVRSIQKALKNNPDLFSL